MSKTEKKEQISPKEHVFASQKSQKYVEILKLMIEENMNLWNLIEFWNDFWDETSMSEWESSV